MLRGVFDGAGDRSPDALRQEYESLLAETVRAVGLETVATATDIGQTRLQALLDGDSPALTVSEAAAILATDEDRPDAETIAAEARDILLMGMSIAVLDVEALASALDDRLEPNEIQQKVEGRQPLSLGEYALLHSTIEGHK